MEHTDLRIGRYIGRLYNMMRRCLWKETADSGYGGAEIKVLSFILDTDSPVFQKDIEEEFSLRSPTATELLKKMEGNGLIIRVQEEGDARCKRIIPTEKSLGQKDMIFSCIRGFDKDMARGIPEKDIIIFCRTAEKMIANIKKEITEEKHDKNSHGFNKGI